MSKTNKLYSPYASSSEKKGSKYNRNRVNSLNPKGKLPFSRTKSDTFTYSNNYYSHFCAYLPINYLKGLLYTHRGRKIDVLINKLSKKYKIPVKYIKNSLYKIINKLDQYYLDKENVIVFCKWF